MSMVYMLLVTIVILGAVLWSNRVFTKVVSHADFKISWHRLVSPNIYLIVLKTQVKIWKIEIVINSDHHNVNYKIDEEKNVIEVLVNRGACMGDLVRGMETISSQNDNELTLFFSSLSNPINASPLFTNKNDFDNYEEMIYYMNVTMKE